MKQSLQLKIGQSMTMTPQLQQAIKLLQLSTLELQLEIQAQLDANPMLEIDEAEVEIAQNPLDDALDNSQKSDESIDLDTTQLPDDLPIDANWEDTYEPTMPQSSSTNAVDAEGQSIFDRTGSVESLQDHLLSQIELTTLSPLDKLIGYSIIESITDQGYLSASFADIQESVLSQMSQLPDIDSDAPLLPPNEDEIKAVLCLIHNLDPIGCGARDLKECLSIQLKQLPSSTPMQNEAVTILTRHFDLLSRRDFSNLMRRMKLTEEALSDTIALLQSLNPRPGNQIGDSHADYVIPDVIVRHQGDRWYVSLNPATLPKLRLNQTYASLGKQQEAKQDRDFIRNHVQDAKWFIKSLRSRHDTLLKVAREIVRRQIDFFNIGPEAMKPMVLADVAKAVDMHESTISRVTSQKYMHTPTGLFELKFFFSSHVNTTEGGEASSTAIRAFIKKIITEENQRKPLSDNKIAQLLESVEGIKIARRTVAKYRELMNIPASSDRKQLM